MMSSIIDNQDLRSRAGGKKAAVPRGQGFFARWSAWGALLPLWLLGAGTVLLIAGRALRPARTPPV